MDRMVSIASLALVAVIGVNDVASGEDAVPSSPPLLLTANSTTEKELLLFYEEADLYTATKRTTTLRKAPAIATIITAEEIRNMGARNLLDVLKIVPGLGISITEFNEYMIEVRGIRTALNEKILVMIDGHSLNRNFTGSALYNVADMLPMENVKQVEVVRGPGSALYGNSAFVATINIITRNAEEINGLEVKGGGGSFNSFKGNILGGKEIGEELTISGSLDHYQTNGPNLVVEADTLTGTPFSLAPGRPDLKIKKTDAFFKGTYGDLSLRGHYLTKRKNSYIGLASALTDSSWDRVQNYWGEAAYNLPLGQSLSTSFKVYHDHYEQDPFVKIFPNGFAGVFPEGMVGRPLVKNRTIGGELQTDWDITEDNHLIAGMSYEDMRQYDVKQLANFDPLTGAPYPSIQEVANWNKDARRRILALYAQDEWQLLEQLNLTGGVRYDNYSDFGDTVNFRTGIVWNFLENADLKLLYGQAFRAPNFQELYNINNSTVVGNPDLKPEKIKTYEAALAWRHSRYLAADINYFFSVIDDLISWDTSTTPAVNANMGKWETEGVETGIHGAYGTEIEWRLTYSWQNPRDADTDQRLPYVPSNRASAGINYSPNMHINLHGNLLWTGKRPRTETDSRPEMPSYTTADLAVTLKNFFKSLEVQATVRNLFDKRYKDPDTSGGNVNFLGTGPKVPGDFPREGISAFVTASYRF